MGLKIIGTGKCVPKKVVTNDYLATIMDTSDEWISSRTGIKERRIAEDETIVSMSVKAAEEALKQANIKPADLDLIIVGTLTPDVSMPNTACLVQKELGAEKAMCIEVNSACTGFMCGLNTAYAYMTAGIYKTALVVGAEILSRIVDWEDRKTAVLFGDGAGAAVAEFDSEGLFELVQRTDGGLGENLTCDARQTANLFNPTDFRPGYVAMDGQEVFMFAVRRVTESIKQVHDKAGCDKNDIDCFILHQANKRIINTVAKRLGVEEIKFPTNLERYGNTSAASIPILLDELNKEGKLKKGSKIILSGFGGGLSWATSLMEW